MIDLPDAQAIKELNAFKEPSCLSIYISEVDFASGSNAEEIQLKNLLKEGEKRLAAGGVETNAIKKTTQPAWKLLEGNEFWPLPRTGAALFMHPGMFRYYHLPNHAIPTSISVGRGFNLKPLQKELKNVEPYYLLAISHNHVQLYEGNQYQLRPVYIKNFPTNLKRALNIDEYPNERQTHTIAPASLGKGSEAFHGQYNPKQVDKTMLLQFFRLIDGQLRKFLKNKDVPLILACVGYLVPIYKQANTYPHLSGQWVKGNPDGLGPDQLLQKILSLPNG